MNKKLILLGQLCLTTAIATGFTLSAAQAGFQWNPPPAKPSAPAPSQNAMSSLGNIDGPLLPMPGEAAPVEPVSEMDIMDETKMAPVTQRNESFNAQALPVPRQSAPQQPPMSLQTALPNVEGFGKDIPLAVALRQVVPPAYMLSFAPGLDQGKPVSWNGGRPWNDVVTEMLAERKLHATLQGNTLMVAEGHGPALMPPAPMMAEAPMLYQGGIAMDQPLVGRPVVNLSEHKKWTAQPGQSLRETLQSWSNQANVELAWEENKDFSISQSFTYDGTFDQAVDSLLSLYGDGGSAPRGKLYPNLPEGPSVLLIGQAN